LKNIKNALKISGESISFLSMEKENKWNLLFSKSFPFNLIDGHGENIKVEELNLILKKFEFQNGKKDITLVIDDLLLESFIYKGITINKDIDIEKTLAEIANEKFGIELSDYLYDFKLFKTEELSFMFYGIKKEFFKKIEASLKSFSINVEKIEAESSAILNFLYEKIKKTNNKNILYIHIGRFKTLIFSMEKSDPTFYRLLDVGYGHIKSQGKNINIIPKTFSSTDGVNILLETIEKSGSGLKNLLETIEKTIRGIHIHYQSRTVFDSFYLSGILNENSDFILYLEEYLQITHINIEKQIEFVKKENFNGKENLSLALSIMGNEDL